MKVHLRPDAFNLIEATLQTNDHSLESLAEAFRSVSIQISPISGFVSTQFICHECGHSIDHQAIQCSVLEIEAPTLDIDPLLVSHKEYFAALSEAAYYTRILVLPPNGSSIVNLRLLSTKLSATYLQTLIPSMLDLPTDTPLAALSIDKEIVGLVDIFADDDDINNQDRTANLERFCRLNFGANHCIIIVPILAEEVSMDNTKDVIIDIFINSSAASISIPLIINPDKLDNLDKIIRKRLALFYSNTTVRDSILSQNVLLDLIPTSEYSFKCVVSFDASTDLSILDCDFCAVFRSCTRVYPTLQYTLKDCIEYFLKEKVDSSLTCQNCNTKGSVFVQKRLTNLGNTLSVMILNHTSHILLQDIIDLDSVQHTVVLAVLLSSSGEFVVAHNKMNQMWSIKENIYSLTELQRFSCVFFISVEKQTLAED